MSQVRFHPINEYASKFPPPAVPVLPILRWKERVTSTPLVEKDDFDSVFFHKSCQYTSSGRTALARVLHHLGLTETDEVLIPAYHCGSMIEPLIWAGCRPIFYDVTSSLDPDVTDIQAKTTSRTKALIIVHFFGFTRILKQLKEYCDENHIVLIEDCAHSFFGRKGSASLPGMTGTYAIASIKKFFPSGGGGIIRGPRSWTASKNRPPFKKQLSPLIEAYRNVKSFGIVPEKRKKGQLPEYQPANINDGEKPVIQPQPHVISNYQWLDPSSIFQSATLFSRLAVSIGHRHVTDQCARRREHFLQLLESLSGLAGGYPLYDELPDGTAPYMFPFVLRNPDSTFFSMKMNRIPIWRWEELATSDCPIAQGYRERLIQIPCHQSLTSDELSWITDMLQKILAKEQV